MANSTESYGLLKFEKLQNCCPSSDTGHNRSSAGGNLDIFCSHRGVDGCKVIFKILFLTVIEQH